MIVALCFVFSIYPPVNAANAVIRWRFDPASAVIGLFIGLLLALGVYLLRDRFSRLREMIASRVLHTRSRLSASTQARYCRYIIEMTENAHLLNYYAPLSSVFVEPRLIVPPMRLHAVSSPDDEQNQEYWRNMRMYDLLYPTPETILIGDALKQSRHLALLGPGGSGRTTILFSLAQRFARRPGDPPVDDQTPMLAEPPAQDAAPERLPLYLELDALDRGLFAERGRHALLKPISAYLTARLPKSIAAPSASMLRSRLINGECAILCDNLDLLDARARDRSLRWLDQLARTYPANVIVIGGAAEGYGALIELGFVPLLLKGFDRRATLQFVDKWDALREAAMLEAWNAEMTRAQVEFEAARNQARREGRPPPDENDLQPPAMPAPPPDLLALWPRGRRSPVLPLDLAVAAMLWREYDEVPATRLLCFDRVVALALGRAGHSLLSPPHWGRVLTTWAWELHRQGRDKTPRSDLETLIADMLERSMQQANGAKPASDLGKLARTALDALLKAQNLLVDAGGDQVTFTHRVFRAYFAAQCAARDDLVDRLIEHVGDPHWQDTLLFFAALSSASALVIERLKGNDDVFLSNFVAAAEYLIASPESTRQLLGGVLAELAQVLLNPRRPTSLRRQAAEVIARAEAAGALYLFGQALKHDDPHIRAVGAWGLAHVESEQALRPLYRALSDRDRLVRIEALHALGQRGGNRVIEGIIQGLQDEDELVRRVAAEALARLGKEGCTALREAIASSDFAIRRAVIYGLALIDAPWAFEIVDRLSRDDPEWFVRSAAQDVLIKIDAGPPAVLPECRPEKANWLVNWAIRHGRRLQAGDDALALLEHALAKGDEWTRLAAIDALQACGGKSAVGPLGAALASDSLLVRDAAYSALCEVGRRTGVRVAVK